MARKLKANTGIERIEIVNEYDEQIGVYVFKPANAGRIFSKLIEKAGELEAMAGSLDAVPNTNDEQAAQAFVKAYAEMEKKVITWFDEVFEADSYAGFFKDTSPLAPVNGDFFFVQILNVLSQFIQEEVNFKMDDKTKKLNDYIAPYAT